LGGDPACSHLEQRGGRNPETSAKQLTNQGTVRTQYSAVCADCGAQRVDAQIGLEKTPDAYVSTLVHVFREVRRVLKPSGTLWLNLGDSLADKQLLGVPWRVAFALQDAGWYLRQNIIWHKLNPMPESVLDRPTTSHEHVFLLAKSDRYFYDGVAIAELGVSAPGSVAGYAGYDKRAWAMGRAPSGNEKPGMQAFNTGSRNKRSVWSIATEPYSGAHFATFPQALVTPCILAGTSQHGNCAKCGAPWERVTDRKSRVGAKRGTQASQYRANLQGPQQSSVSVEITTVGWRPTCPCGAVAGVRAPLVLDPFLGSGTTGVVAERLGRRWVGLDLGYHELSRERTAQMGLKFSEASV